MTAKPDPNDVDVILVMHDAFRVEECPIEYRGLFDPIERGVTEAEVIATVEEGESFPAKCGRVGFRRNFPFNYLWAGKHYLVKQVEAYAVKEEGEWIVVTVIARYF